MIGRAAVVNTDVGESGNVGVVVEVIMTGVEVALDDFGMPFANFVDRKPDPGLRAESAVGQCAVFPDQRLGTEFLAFVGGQPKAPHSFRPEDEISLGKIEFMAEQITVEHKPGSDLGDGVGLGVGKEKSMQDIARG